MAGPLRILERERAAILNSLGTGLVPRIGIHHVQVGRKAEVAALLDDLKRVEGGSAAVRFVVGRYGAGKSFFLHLIQTVALERKFVIARADITTDCRLHATGGQAQRLYSELMKNLSTRSKPDGGALASLVERWVSDVAHEVKGINGTDQDVENALAARCKPLQDLVGGYDFVSVLTSYYRGHLTGNDQLQTNAVRWLRAEYATKTEARQDLGVRSIIDDDSIYDFLKLFGRFAKIAGYAGLLICLDELVVLSHRLNNRVARNNNYEAVLKIVNDCVHGGAENIGFIFAATDEAMFDKRRGLFSYEALASRLATNRFAQGELVDLSGPVLTLPNLTPEDCYVLLHNVRRVHAGDGKPPVLPDEGIEAYLTSCQQRMGAAYYQTPREIVKDFVGLLNVLAQNPTADWKSLIGNIKTADVSLKDPSVVAAEQEPRADGDDDAPVVAPQLSASNAASAKTDDDELATFKL